MAPFPEANPLWIILSKRQEAAYAPLSNVTPVTMAIGACRIPESGRRSLAGPFQRLVLIGALDDILANGLDPLARERGRERDHAVCGKGAVVDDRHPAILVVECGAAPQVRQHS